jgi:hypothetical protein
MNLIMEHHNTLPLLTYMSVNCMTPRLRHSRTTPFQLVVWLNSTQQTTHQVFSVTKFISEFFQFVFESVFKLHTLR